MEKQKDKELVNRRYRWGAAAQEQLEVTGHFNDPQGTSCIRGAILIQVGFY